MPLPQLYEAYATTCRARLKAGCCWRWWGDPELLDRLVDLVPKNRAFFRQRVREEFPVVEYLLSGTDIAVANRNKLRMDRPEEQRRTEWLRLLR